MSNIFVVDDSISVRKALELSLKREGMNVRSAASGEQALEKLDEEPFDLLIADVIMPGINGFELCQQLKNNPKYSGIPVLIISGNVDADVKAEAHDAGAVGVLKKPFRQEELMPAVQKALATSAAAPISPAPTEATPAVEPRGESAAPTPAPTQPTPTQATPTQATQGGAPFAAMLERATTSSSVLGAMVVSADGEVLGQRGEPMPPQMGQYARFYMGTANFLSGQLKETGRPQVEIELGGKRLTIRSLGEHMLVTLGRL